MHLFSLKRLCGGLKVRVEQIWWEICDQGPRVPQRRIPLGGCFIDLPSYRPLGRSRFCCHKKYRHCMIFRHLTGFLRHTINRVLSRLQIRASDLTSTRRSAGPSHRIPKPSYITLRREIGPALLENYASELYQVMILQLSRAGLTS